MNKVISALNLFHLLGLRQLCTVNFPSRHPVGYGSRRTEDSKWSVSSSFPHLSVSYSATAARVAETEMIEVFGANTCFTAYRSYAIPCPTISRMGTSE
jgi:hypothetical protein